MRIREKILYPPPPSSIRFRFFVAGGSVWGNRKSIRVFCTYHTADEQFSPCFVAAAKDAVAADGKQTRNFAFNYAFSALGACCKTIFARKFGWLGGFPAPALLQVSRCQRAISIWEACDEFQAGVTIDRDFKIETRSREEDVSWYCISLRSHSSQLRQRRWPVWRPVRCSPERFLRRETLQEMT